MAGLFAERAQQVQDEIGWADSTNPMEMGRAMLHLAQLVRDIGGALDALHHRLNEASEALHEFVVDTADIEDI